MKQQQHTEKQIEQQTPDMRETPGNPINGVRIAVVDNGFVFIGILDCIQTLHGSMVIISNAKNIRSWGTSKGLGELKDGPLSQTITDEVGTMTVPLSRIVFTFATNAKKWGY